LLSAAVVGSIRYVTGMTLLSDRTIAAAAPRTQIRKSTLEIGVLQRERAVLARRFDMAEGGRHPPCAALGPRARGRPRAVYALAGWVLRFAGLIAAHLLCARRVCQAMTKISPMRHMLQPDCAKPMR
jgi:hypothetical protein